MERYHTIPTHLQVQSKLTVGRLSFSPKQALLLFCGIALSYRLWHLLLGVVPQGGGASFLVSLVLASPPLLLSVALGWITIASRSLDVWLILALLYLGQPKQVLWRSIQPEIHAAEEGETDA